MRGASWKIEGRKKKKKKFVPLHIQETGKGRGRRVQESLDEEFGRERDVHSEYWEGYFGNKWR